jgi:hypothetical protein
MRDWIGRLVTLAACAVLANACGTSTSTSLTAPSARCGVNASAQPATVGAPGGSGSIVVATNRECAWEARSEAEWLSLSTTAGQGDGSLTFAAAANALVIERRGVVVVNGARVEITQGAAACLFTLDQPAGAIDSDGGRIDVRVTAQAGCAWTAVSQAPWITVAAGSGQGPGIAALTVQRNAAFEARTGTVTIAGHTFVIEQGGENPAPVPPPTPAPGPTDPTPPPTPGPTPGPTPEPTPTPPPTPAPTPTPTPPPTPTPTPTPTPCTFTVTPSTASFAAEGGGGELVVTASAATCTWTAASGEPWITIVSPAGTAAGSGRVSYIVAAHTATTRREAPLTVAGATVTIAQAPAPPPPDPCTFTVTPTTATLAAAGGTGEVVVTTSASTCSWTAASGAAWIAIQGAAGGTGSGRISYTVAENTATAERSGTLTVAGTGVSITQAAAPPPPPPPCTYTVAPTEIRTTLLGGQFDITIDTASTCAWTAVSQASWITVNGTGSGTGSGSVRITVAVTLLNGRTGTIAVAGQTVTVTQSPLLVRASGREDE